LLLLRVDSIYLYLIRKVEKSNPVLIVSTYLKNLASFAYFKRRSLAVSEVCINTHRYRENNQHAYTPTRAEEFFSIIYLGCIPTECRVGEWQIFLPSDNP
jgi:hypothetical protein